MRPSSLSSTSSPYAPAETPAVTTAPQGAPSQSTPTSSPARGHGALGNLPGDPGRAAPAGRRSPLAFAWRRSAWSQALQEAYAAGHGPQPQHAPPESNPLDEPRLYDPRQRTLKAAHDGRLTLAQVPLGTARRYEALSATALIEQIAGIAAPQPGGPASAGGAARGEASSSSPAPAEAELSAQLASNDPAVVLALAQQAAQRACEAAEAARAGSMAALVAAHGGGLDAGGPSGSPLPLQALREHTAAARAHLNRLHAALATIETAFGPFDVDDDESSVLHAARSMIEQAHTALATLESDVTHCFVAQAVAEHRLPPEAAVLGHVAALRELHPAVFELDQGGGDPHVLEGLASLASNTARDLRALMGAADADDRAALQNLGGGAVDLSQALHDAVQTVVTLRAACPQGATHDALGALFDAAGDALVWLEGEAPPGAGTPIRLPPHSPLLTPAAHTPVSNETVEARMAELAVQRHALAQLPVLATRSIARNSHNPAARDRELGGLIERVMTNAIGVHTPLDTRIELARVAMHFAPAEGPERSRLARALTSRALRVDAPTTSEVHATLGTDDDGENGAASLARVALFDRLGDVMGSLGRDEALRFARTLDDDWDIRDSRRGASALRLAAMAIAQRRSTSLSISLDRLALPSDPAAFGVWLGDSGQRNHWVSTYIEACSVSRHTRTAGGADATVSYTDNRTALRQLVKHASNMAALRGHRHHFVKLVKDLLERDDKQIDLGHRPVVGSAQRLELLQAMAAQLPQFGHASGDRQTVSDVLGLILREMTEPHMQTRHRVRLAKELIAVTGQLSTSRFSGSDAAQSHALDSIGVAVLSLRGVQSTALLRELLASRLAWSGERSAGADIARTRGKKRFVLGSSLFPPAAMIHAASYAMETVKGRSSPKDEALQLVLQTLERRLEETVDNGYPAPVELIPVYGDLLRQLLDASARPGGKPDASSLARALSCMVRGGLPADGDAHARDRRLSAVFGEDPEMRAAVARSLTQAIRDKTGPASSPFGRLSSARYLQNLLAAGGGNLSQDERQAALAAIHRAAASKSLNSSGRRERVMLNTLVREALRDGIRVEPEVMRRTVSQTIALLRAVPGAVREAAAQHTMEDRAAAAAPVHDAANQMRQLVSFYPTLDAQTRGEVRAVLLGCAPAVPAQHREREAIAQLPLLAFATSLSHFAGARPEDARQLLELHAQVWPRLNATNQEAAIHDLFDAYDEAMPAGREAVLSFVRRLGEPRTFVSAAVKLIGSTVADDAMRATLGEAESGRIIAAVLERMRTLPADSASDLVASVLADTAVLPQALIDGFIAQAGTLQPRTLAQVLSAELKRLPTLPPQQAADVLSSWDRTARQLQPGSPQRDTLALFSAIAAQAHPQTGRRASDSSRIAVPEEAASQLSSALPTFEPRLQEVVLSHIAGEHAPPAMRREIVDDLFRGFAQAAPRQRLLAIRLGGRAGIGRGLEALAQEFGAPRYRAGQVVRPGLDQAFLPAEGTSRLGGELSTLRAALEDRARRPEEVCVALETIAERFLALPKTPFQDQFAELFEGLAGGGRLPPALLRRVVDTLELAEARQSEVGRVLLQRHGQALSPDIKGIIGREEARARLNALRAQRGAVLERRARLTRLSATYRPTEPR